MLRATRFVMSLAILLSAAWAQNPPNSIEGGYAGRYHCGHWTEFYLQIKPISNAVSIGPLTFDQPGGPSDGISGVLQFYFSRSIIKRDSASYSVTGTYDAKTGGFHLEPKSWIGPHPAVLEMIGMEGTRDPASRKLMGKMLSGKCDTFELFPPGTAVPPLPPEPPQPAEIAPNNKLPERRLGPSNVTNYLDPASFSPDFEYWVTAWSDRPGTVHEGEPIDDVVEQMKKDKFACLGSQRVTWDASGLKGTAPDKVTITERFVVECVGDCKNVFYRPYVGANVTHFGLTSALPTMQIKSVFLGGTSFKWNFSLKTKTQPAPDIYIHRWRPLAGWGPFDPKPAEVARIMAAAPPCRAPKNSR